MRFVASSGERGIGTPPYIDVADLQEYVRVISNVAPKRGPRLSIGSGTVEEIVYIPKWAIPYMKQAFLKA